jgi:CO/xanthine dehydrogenase Mo-binding subunit
MLTGRSVKFAYSPTEEMQVSSPRAAERIYIEDGVMNDGRIIARKVTLFVDAGAYSRHSPCRTTKAAAHIRDRTTFRTSMWTHTASTPTGHRPLPCAASA